jgi:glycine/D-amino acid oxidase-like deaminating enzyme
MDPETLAQNYPWLVVDDLSSGLLEPGSGFLLAARSCRLLLKRYLQEGGQYRLARIEEIKSKGQGVQSLLTRSGDEIRAQQFVFACGAWSDRLLPQIGVGGIDVTRQEMFYFRPPNQRAAKLLNSMPVWAIDGDEFWYGVPGVRGTFQLANDSRGESVCPETQSRIASTSGLREARQYLNRRFPWMVNAQLIGSRVCQYTQTPDSHFIIGPVPDTGNAWIMTGGSGHGFKHGPALGECLAAAMTDGMPLPAEFSPNRFWL